MPVVSVVMPAHNAAETITDALASVQAQTHGALEILVVDDCSSDDTFDVALTLAKTDPRIKVLRTPFNMGPSGARNVALKALTGEWVTLIDSDDWWVADRVRLLLKAAKDFEADVVLDNLLIFDHASGEIVERTRFAGCNKATVLTPDNIFQFDTPLRGRNLVGYSKPFIKSDLLAKSGRYYSELYRFNEDLIFLVDLVMTGARIIIIPDCLYVYRHQFSPTTGTRSPFTHAASSTDLAIEISDHIADKYRHRLSSKAHGALRRRKQMWLAVSVIQQQKDFLAEGRWFAAIGLFWKAPFLFAIRASNLWRRIKTPLRRFTLTQSQRLVPRHGSRARRGA